ncbi:MAG: virulence RhuM family protein [Deltaproteobacteria bacterium]|nr:virulence RhuM family protein [Deltaproteobacteria bacterium]
MTTRKEPPPDKGELIIYQTEDGKTKVEVRLQDETVWLSQKVMAELSQKDLRTINEHIGNIYDEGELVPEATIRKFRIVQSEGARQVAREIDHYNLDVAISVGYRVKSQRATQFRIHGQTAAEVIYHRADAAKPHMGMTTWTGGRPRKADAEVAKNYLDEKELDLLNRIVSMYLDFAELQALSRHPMHMRDWFEKLDDFLKLSGRDILIDAGKISHDEALAKAHAEYERFHRDRINAPSEVERHCLEAVEEIKRIAEPPKRGRRK